MIQHRTLSEVCLLITDGSHFSPSTIERGLPYVTVRNLRDGLIDIESCAKISAEDFDKLSKNGCQPILGDVLFSKDGTVGKVAVVEDNAQFVVLSSIAILRPNPTILSSRYLALALQSPAVLESALGMKSGTAIRRVVLRSLKTLEIPVPPLEQQHEIVERIEAALARVRDCQTGLEFTRQKQADLRRKLFHDSFVGGPTLEAKTPFPGTEVASLGEIATWGSGGTPSTKVPSHYVGNIPWAVIGDLTESHVIRTEKSISAEALKSSSAKIFPEGSVMVAMYGASIGRTGIAGIDMATNQAIAVAQPNPSKVRGDYLLYFLQSQKEAFVAAGQGGAQPNISQQVIKGWRIALPSLSEQKRVVQELDLQFARLASASKTHSHLRLQIANLKAAVLTSSFTQKSVGEIQ